MNTIWKIFSMVSFGLLVYSIFFQKEVVKAVDLQPVEFRPTGQVFYIAEEMPRFPGCEDSGLSKEARHQCADKKMLEFVYSNLKIPASCRSFDGNAVVQFTVETDGSLTDIKILKGLQSGLGEELVRVVEMMPDWMPGKQFGKEVRIRFTLPVKVRFE